MNLGQLASKARDLVQKRGGTDSVKEDAQELRDIASASGSLGDKAKAAAEAVKDPGADETARPAQPAQAPPRPDGGGGAEAGPEAEAGIEPGHRGRRATRRRAGRRRRR
jgi:hypothetical protein